MSYDVEERKFMQKLEERINQVIEEVLRSFEYGRAYFEFKMIATTFDQNFNKADEVVVFDDSEKHFCMFCRKEGHYYYEKEEGYLCADCYRKLFGKVE